MLFSIYFLTSQRLRVLYSKILASLQVMPQDAAYRKYTEQLVNDRFNLIKTVGLPDHVIICTNE